MGLFSTLGLIFSGHRSAPQPASRRRGAVEHLEPRQMLAADGLAPDEVLLGSVYFEEATGDDSEADIIQIGFVGGAEGTTLDQITISGDKFGDGLTSGDTFFDTVAGGIGAFEAVGYSLVSNDGFSITGVAVADGGTDIVITFDDFEAGEKLIFSIDVDEAQAVNPATDEVVLQNSLVEGAEFELNTIVGEFSAEGYVDLTLSATYYDAFDDERSAAETATGLALDLPDDRYESDDDKTDRSAGAVAHTPQIPLASISGYVYHDRSDDGVYDRISAGGDEEPIAGVTIELLDENGQGTGVTTVTNSDGYYEFLNLTAGVYGVQEVNQPAPYLDGKDTAGSHGGVAGNEIITGAVLDFGDHATEYNFGELLTGSIAGRVHASNDADCDFDDPDILLAGVRIDLLDARGNLITFTTTDSEGRYQFNNLAPGEYQVREHQPEDYYDGGERAGTAGGVVADDLISGIRIGSDEHAVDYDFCEHVGASLSGFVYHDRDDDGQFDPGEDPIAGVELKLLAADGTDTGKRAVTNSSGYYEFTDLAPGKYTVMENQPEGWYDGKDTPGSLGGNASVNDMIAEIMLDFGDNSVNNNFGELLGGSIAGRVHASNDPDCDFENPDILLEGVTIQLLDAEGNVIDEMLTDSEGRYKFDDLAPGEYQVRELQPAGYYDGGERAGTAGGVVADDLVSGIVIGSEVDAVNYDFCEHVGATLSGYVYHDQDDDGLFDSGENPIEGVDLKLIDATGAVIATAVTNGAGYYQFTNLDAGKYTVMESQPAGYYDGKDTPGTTGGDASVNDMISQIMLDYGQHSQQNNFGELLGGSIAGRVHASNDEDCDFDDPDILLAGVQIDLLDADGNFIKSAFTDSEGRYLFDDLAPGEYQVREHQPSGYYDGGERVGTAGGSLGDDLITGIVIGSDQHAVNYDFCEHVGGTLSGYVYHDPDNDGLFESGENPISGVSLKLIDASGAVIGTTTTNTEGYYEFTNLDAGKYAVMETQPAGWYDGKDTPGTTGGDASVNDMLSQIMLSYGGVSEQNNFGELLGGSISGRVHASNDADCDFEDPDILLAGVQIDLLDGQGNFIKSTFTNSEGRYTFDDLAPGEYQVREHQPEDYFDGGERIGTAGGSASDDLITGIELGAEQDAVNYDFCEHVGATLSGYVYHDRDDDGLRDPGEEPIEGVELKLLDGDGVDTGRRAITTASGFYQFSDLAPGKYTVMEVHPEGWYDGKDTPGTTGGDASVNDMIAQIMLDFGDNSVENNFGELLGGSISGSVHVSTDPDCEPTEDDAPIAGVTIELLDETGAVIATTETNANGEYEFTNLRPGIYSVRELQPEDYFDGGNHVGDGGGSSLNFNLIADIDVGSDEHWVNYDFCEMPPASLSGYVFIDGAPIVSLDELTPEDIAAVKDGQRTSDDTPLEGVVLELRDGLTGGVIMGDQALPGYYGDGPITTVTDANGFYEFTGLPAGVYAVVEIHPEGLIDSFDTPGSLGGLAVNAAVPFSGQVFLMGGPTLDQQQAIDQFRDDFGTDALLQINLAVGENSVENNFSEVQQQPFLPPTENPESDPPPPVFAPPPLAFNPQALPPLAPPTITPEPFIGGSSQALGWTWHLSVINAGHPRQLESSEAEIIIEASTQLSASSWEQAEMDRAEWRLIEDDQEADEVQRFLFGNEEGIPVAGDWDGDGRFEIGVFVSGYWYLDLNANGRWDRGDLWAHLGSENDLPVTGDWDGDGKTDIGIFGPAWPRDPHAIAREPGLPDAENYPTRLPDERLLAEETGAGKMKNMPPTIEDATSGARILRKTIRGRGRADLIDHVFHYGAPGDTPIAGDWNGDGIRTIGVFRDGAWQLDTDGDGRVTEADLSFVFGQAGDRPAVGDWNGDGIDDLGVFRGGQWLVDSNGNRELDAVDAVFELGGESDLPIVGDWDGDGVDEPGAYGPSQPEVRVSQKAG